MVNSRAVAAIMLAGMSMLTGCASIVNGSNQVISVDTRHQGQMLVGASCQLINGKGTFYVTTPGTITIRRAYDDLNIKCEKEGLLPGTMTVKSSTKAMAFGNILLGGVVGAAVDAGTGAAYDYPSVITVLMDGSIGAVAPATTIAPSTAISAPAASGQL